MWPIYVAVVIFLALLSVAGYLAFQTAMRLIKRTDELLNFFQVVVTDSANAHRVMLGQMASNSAAGFISIRNELVSRLEKLHEAHEQSLQSLSDGHASVMSELRHTHGDAALRLEAATVGHRESARELREASTAINAWLRDSNLSVIAEHLAALKKFFTNS